MTLKTLFVNIIRYKNTLKNNKLLENTPKLLSEHLNCSLNTAELLYRDNKNVFEGNYISKLKLLKRHGFGSNFIINNPNLLSLSENSLSDRLSVLNLFPATENNLTLRTLANLRDDDLTLLVKLIKTDRSKIMQMTKIFECSVGETAHLLLKHRFLLRSKPSTLLEKINVLLKGGFTIDQIKKDTWVLTYNVSKLVERTEMIHKMNLHPVKTWMLRCQDSVLERTINLREENRLAMAPLESNIAYLCNRLKINESQVETFASRHPPVLRVQVAKLKEIIDYLLSEGFTESQIYLSPRILCHSLSTIQSRMNVLKERKYIPYTLSILCKSNRDFQELLNKMKVNYEQF